MLLVGRRLAARLIDCPGVGCAAVRTVRAAGRGWRGGFPPPPPGFGCGASRVAGGGRASVWCRRGAVWGRFLHEWCIQSSTFHLYPAAWWRCYCAARVRVFTWGLSHVMIHLEHHSLLLEIAGYKYKYIINAQYNLHQVSSQ